MGSVQRNVFVSLNKGTGESLWAYFCPFSFSFSECRCCVLLSTSSYAAEVLDEFAPNRFTRCDKSTIPT